MGIKTRLTLMFALVAFILAVLLSGMGYLKLDSQIRSAIEKETTLSVESYTADFNNWLLARSKVVETTALILQNSVSEQQLELSHLLAFKDPSNSADISDLYVGYESGKFLDGSGWIPDPGYDPRGRPWYISIKEAGKLVFTDPYLDQVTQKYAISVGMPLKDKNGKFTGVVAEDILLSTLTDNVNKIDYYGGHGIMLDSKGTVLANPDPKLVNVNINDNEELKAIFGDILSNEKGIKDFRSGNSDKLMIYRKIPATGWLFAITVEKSLVYQGLTKVRFQFILVSIIILLLVIGAGFFISDRVAKPIITLTQNSNRMSKGDLTVRAEVTGKDEISVLSGSYNTMAENLSRLIGRIAESVKSVTNSAGEVFELASEAGRISEEVSHTTDEIAKGSSDQASSLQKGTVMVDNVMQSIGSISHNVSDSVNMSQSVNSAINSGLDAVLNQQALMEENKKSSSNVYISVKELEDNSNKIGQLVNAIANIATQTNLLSLNAAIEAARAGEQGKGFAVVAEEVRKLAQQAAVSSNEIAALLYVIKDGTGKSVKEMELANEVVSRQEKALSETRQCFDNIRESVRIILDKINEVSISSGNVNVNTKKVSEVIESIAAVAEESAAATQEVAAATVEQSRSVKQISDQSRKLIEEVEELLKEVQRFKT
ncbi:MAG: methyl-accepting chemotaxis protein [Clostridiales bacterium]|nr:methyl-accepting chemotaxis protein [Clostridiales bacterium]